jgi:teichuronic acid biosynthesis glycosyltransferase TuaG
VTRRTSDISVVIPYYNREQYIDQAIQSVLAQTLKPLEIIIVNDCSRESSRLYLDHYAESCVIVDLPARVGAGQARNEGIRRARGRLIAFLDDDDLWLADKLEVQCRYMEQHPECAAVHSAAWSFSSDKPDVLCPCDWPPPLTLAQALTHDHWVILPTLLIRADAIRALGGFDVRFRGSEDHDFTIRCCATGYRIEGIREPLVRFRRQGQESLTKRHWQMYLTHIKLCWRHRALYHRVYGLRGMVSFLLATLHIASSKTRYVDGSVRFLLRFIDVEYEVKRNYQEPVASVGQMSAELTSRI